MRTTQDTQPPAYPEQGGGSVMAGQHHAAYCPTDGRLLREATAAEVAAYEDANRQRAERTPTRKAACFNEGVRVGDLRIDINTGPGVWFGGAGF